MSIDPAVGGSSNERAHNRVVLPPPFGPTNTVIFPGSTSRSIPCKTSVPLNDFLIFRPVSIEKALHRSDKSLVNRFLNHSARPLRGKQIAKNSIANAV